MPYSTVSLRMIQSDVECCKKCLIAYATAELVKKSS